ncbi:MAG TPA: 6,7-dimethyl-8-ribityllumazine synthase [Caulobacteraceae bacterium]
MADLAPRVLIVEARFYEQLADEMLQGAKRALALAGAHHEVVTVPGALEIPAVIAMAQAGGASFDGYVALGCVIRGETWHFEIVAEQSARALMDISVRLSLAIGNGILTVENEAQAWARARVGEGDKAGAAARACLRMISVKRTLASR